MTKTNTIVVLANPQSTPALLTKPELARRLHVAPRTIDRYIAKRLIPHLKLRSRVLFQWEEVLAHLTSKSQAIEQNESEWSTIVQN